MNPQSGKPGSKRSETELNCSALNLKPARTAQKERNFNTCTSFLSTN
jgi:hypothetical protein